MPKNKSIYLMVNEAGRSAVEMLGVLAIIGILSIVGIVGYRLSLAKYDSNNIWNSARWVVLQMFSDSRINNFQLQEEKIVRGLSDEDLFLVKRETKLSYSLGIGKLNKSVCQQMKNTAPEWVEEVLANEGAGCIDENKNQIKIYFNTQFDSGKTDPDRYKECIRNEDCIGCQVCSIDNICVDTDINCPGNQFCVYGSCEGCEKGWFQSGNKCIKCTEATNVISNTEMKSCHKCFRTRFAATGNRCIRCDIEDWYGSDMRSCLSCQNRYWNGSCQYCDGDVIDNGRGCRWHCPSGEFGSGSLCLSCENKSEIISATKESCQACDGIRFYRGGQCIRCNTLDWKGSTKKEDCTSCEHRYWMKNGSCHYCKGTVSGDGESCNWECKEGEVGGELSADYTASCHSCDLQEPVYYTKKDECLKCPQRYWNSDGSCHYCEGIVGEEGESCQWTCPQGSFGSNSKCMSCDASHEILGNTTPETCKSCKGIRFLRGTQCIRCDTSDWKGSTEQEDCNSCPKRYTVGTTCRYCEGTVGVDGKSCQWECPKGQVGGERYGLGGCYSCDEKRPLEYSKKEDCLSCSHRYWDRGLCRYCAGKAVNNGTVCELTCAEGEIKNQGECYSCVAKEENIPVSSQSCYLCQGSRFWSGYGACWNCNTTDWKSATQKENCTACSNRYWLNGNCRFCVGEVVKDGMACQWSCPQNTFGGERNGLGGCYSCDIKEDISFSSKESCLSCKNRYWPKEGVCRYCDGIAINQGTECIACPIEGTSDWYHLPPDQKKRCSL